MLGVAVELALVVHDHIEVTFKEGGRSWRIGYIGFSGSLARPGASVVVIFEDHVWFEDWWMVASLCDE
jgi:hypothetical protein